ncbi:hypothetical protein ETD86_45855 [Nonomuraea turkmeniaca]|uniref:Uncharacterized protein n=1 Tax=Nonomuraea turkmeniaca TaxID=103838 RepID=A0A5S4EYT6_9ACTN|nr:hypothetical protein [Nonomuraea turkmeniaca]TMR08901.1 hypothetical protein ETD86_45855 [Nonomuraea turkmeniaca]
MLTEQHIRERLRAHPCAAGTVRERRGVVAVYGLQLAAGEQAWRPGAPDPHCGPAYVIYEAHSSADGAVTSWVAARAGQFRDERLAVAVAARLRAAGLTAQLRPVGGPGVDHAGRFVVMEVLVVADEALLDLATRSNEGGAGSANPGWPSN